MIYSPYTFPLRSKIVHMLPMDIQHKVDYIMLLSIMCEAYAVSTIPKIAQNETPE